MAGKLYTPDEMFAAAIKEMGIVGSRPTNDMEWAKVINFVAFNIAPQVAMSATKLFAAIYDCPLPESAIEDIVLFQLQSKGK